jgi:hypothetical protein
VARACSATGQTLQAGLHADANGLNATMSRVVTLDAQARPETIASRQGDGTGGTTLTYNSLVYNQLDQITTRRWNSANGQTDQHTETFIYDQVGRITSAAISAGTTTTVAYNDAGDIMNLWHRDRCSQRRRDFVD